MSNARDHPQFRQMAIRNAARRLLARLASRLGLLRQRNQINLLRIDDYDFQLLVTERHLENCYRKRCARKDRELDQA